jgi:hypothetical protein
MSIRDESCFFVLPDSRQALQTTADGSSTIHCVPCRCSHGRSCQPITSTVRRCCRGYETDLGGNSFGALNLNNFQGRCAQH